MKVPYIYLICHQILDDPVSDVRTFISMQWDRYFESALKMVYDPVRAYWEHPPPWKVAASVCVSVGVSLAFFQWWQQKYRVYRPVTVTPAWEVASWLRSWNKEREAGDPVILNPLRCYIWLHHNLGSLHMATDSDIYGPERRWRGHNRAEIVYRHRTRAILG